MSERTDITRGLTMLTARFLNKSALWVHAAEVTFLCPDPRRVDFVAFEPLNGFGRVASIERGKATFFELKSCMDDYNSGHGQSWLGDVNYLVCPAELHVDVNSVGKLPYGVGVLAPVEKSQRSVTWDIDRQRFNIERYKGQTDGWELREICRPQEGCRAFTALEVVTAIRHFSNGREPR